MTRIENVRLREDGQAVVILDQSLLPHVTKYLHLELREEMVEAIQKLRVRGAPAIGIFAAYGLYVLAARRGVGPDFARELLRDGEALASARPTAVNLRWAIGRMLDAALTKEEQEKASRSHGPGRGLSGPGLSNIERIRQMDALEKLRREAIAIQEEDVEMCRRISELGLTLVKDGDGILTHCNAGPLATSGYGTALGPILLGTERGMDLHVFADETRPLLQGARLTAYELDRAGVDVTLICDSMAATVMKQGLVQACFVGCDRVAANGDTANKIGTSGLAILAKHYGIPFYVLGPTSTVDPDCPGGEEIPIELRDPAEIRELFFAEPSSPETVKCYNPAFDVTDHSLISGIVTEKGIARPPYRESLRALLKPER